MLRKCICWLKCQSSSAAEPQEIWKIFDQGNISLKDQEELLHTEPSFKWKPHKKHVTNLYQIYIHVDFLDSGPVIIIICTIIRKIIRSIHFLLLIHIQVSGCSSRSTNTQTSLYPVTSSVGVPKCSQTSREILQCVLGLRSSPSLTCPKQLQVSIQEPSWSGNFLLFTMSNSWMSTFLILFNEENSFSPLVSTIFFFQSLFYTCHGWG